MKNTKSRVLIIVSLLLVAIFCFASCNKVDAEGLWENAMYLKDTTVGKGEKEVKIDVVIEEKSVTITVKTDKDMLGDALYENELVNDPAFFDTLNGIKADWNADKAYWGFYLGEDYMPVGINETKIEGGEHYRFVYTK